MNGNAERRILMERWKMVGYAKTRNKTVIKAYNGHKIKMEASLRARDGERSQTVPGQTTILVMYIKNVLNFKRTRKCNVYAFVRQ